MTQNRDTTPTQKYDLPRPKKGASWAADWDTTVKTIDEQLFETDKIKAYEDNGTVILEDKVNGNQLKLNDDVTMANVASHLIAGDNPHTTTLEQARAEDNQLSGPVDANGNDVTNVGGLDANNLVGDKILAASALVSGDLTDFEGDGLTLDSASLAAALAASGGLKFSSGAIAVEPADIAGALLQDDGSDNLAVDESSIDHDSIDQATVDPDDHHARDHQSRHGAGGADELATALRYAPESEPSTPTSGVVRWYDSGTDAFKAKFDDGSTVTLAEK